VVALAESELAKLEAKAAKTRGPLSTADLNSLGRIGRIFLDHRRPASLPATPALEKPAASGGSDLLARLAQQAQEDVQPAARDESTAPRAAGPSPERRGRPHGDGYERTAQAKAAAQLLEAVTSNGNRAA
jgi:hypothetical protein